jgi:hypothetical protein
MGVYSAVTFGHIAPLLGGTAGGAALEPSALEAVLGAESPVNVLLRANWARQVEGGSPKPSLLRALKQTFWRELLHAALCKLCWGALIVTCECGGQADGGGGRGRGLLARRGGAGVRAHARGDTCHSQRRHAAFCGLLTSPAVSGQPRV